MGVPGVVSVATGLRVLEFKMEPDLHGWLLCFEGGEKHREENISIETTSFKIK